MNLCFIFPLSNFNSVNKFLLLILTIYVFSSFSFQPRKKIWVAIGDSITYLNDHKDETGFRVTKGYLTQVTEELSNVEYINKGFNGWTAGGVAEKFDTLDIPVADCYTIFLGTNDWWNARPLGTIEDYINNDGNNSFFGSYRILIEKIKAINPKADIILITPMQRSDFVYILDPKNNAFGSYRKRAGQSLESFSLAVAKIGSIERLKVINLYADKALSLSKLVKFKRLRCLETGYYKNYSLKQSIDKPYDPIEDEYPYPLEAMGMTYDGLHPSDKGNFVIAKHLISTFRSIGLDR